MISLLASLADPDAYDEYWDVASFGLLYLLGLIVGAAMVVFYVVRWFWVGDARFWWRYERHMWVQKPRKPRGWD